MKRTIIFSLSVIVLLVLIVSCAGQSTPVPEATEAATEEDIDVEALIIERCSGCHSADRVFQEDYSEGEWSDVFDDMIKKGADVNEEEKAIMIDWLISRNK